MENSKKGKGGKTLEINITQQTWFFLYSILLGAALGVFYDLFRILRIAFSHAAVVVMAEDILFWSSSAFVTFVFFLAIDGGQIRLFLILGEGIGFVLYYFSLGTLVIGAAKKIIAVVRWVLNGIYRLVIAPVLFLIGKIFRFLQAIFSGLAFYIKKQAKNSNTHLKKYRRLLYNKKTKVKEWLFQNQRKGSRANESNKRTKK